jgi:hypothetical protein
MNSRTICVAVSLTVLLNCTIIWSCAGHEHTGIQADPAKSDPTAHREPAFSIRLVHKLNEPAVAATDMSRCLPLRSTVMSPDSLFGFHFAADRGHSPGLILFSAPLLDTVAVVTPVSCPKFSPTSEHLAMLRRDPSDDSNRVLSMIAYPFRDEVQPLLKGTSTVHYRWSPQGALIAASAHPRTETQVSVWIVSVDDASRTLVTSNDDLLDYDFTWSPSGRWLAVVGPSDSAKTPESDVAKATLHLFDVTTGTRYTPASSFVCLVEPPIWTSENSVACPDAVSDEYFEIQIGF